MWQNADLAAPNNLINQWAVTIGGSSVPAGDGYVFRSTESMLPEAGHRTSTLVDLSPSTMTAVEVGVRRWYVGVESDPEPASVWETWARKLLRDSGFRQFVIGHQCDREQVSETRPTVICWTKQFGRPNCGRWNSPLRRKTPPSSERLMHPPLVGPSWNWRKCDTPQRLAINCYLRSPPTIDWHSCLVLPIDVLPSPGSPERISSDRIRER